MGTTLPESIPAGDTQRSHILGAIITRIVVIAHTITRIVVLKPTIGAIKSDSLHRVFSIVQVDGTGPIFFNIFSFY